MVPTKVFATNNFRLQVSLACGIGASVAAYYIVRAARRKSFLERTRCRAVEMTRGLADTGCTAALNLMEKGREEMNRQANALMDAVEAGRTAYRRSMA